MASKSDMERVGLFQEMPYHTIGDPYVSQASRELALTKGKQMLPGFPKQKCAGIDGYFNEFQRTFNGEAYTDTIGRLRKSRNQASKKNLSHAWVPSSFPKSYSGVGSAYGTFSGVQEHFSGITRGKKESQQFSKNIITSPAKKGTGYGYCDVTLNKYPEYTSQPYTRSTFSKDNASHSAKILGRGPFQLNMHPTSFFDENPFKSEGYKSGTRSAPSSKAIAKPFVPSSPSKKDGGMKAGTISSFPQYSSSPYKSAVSFNRKVRVVNSTGKTYIPVPGPKTCPQNSIVYQNVLRSINSGNYRTFHGVMSY